MLNSTIFDRLKKEHEKVKTLLKKAEESEGKDRSDLLEQIEEALVPHARAEEKTLYSVLLSRAKKEEQEEAKDLAEEAYEEHRVVDELMAELKAKSVDDETWLSRLTVIKENLEHHIKEEEEELFKQAQALLSDDEVNELLEAYSNAFEKFEKTLPPQSQIEERTASPDARHLQ